MSLFCFSISYRPESSGAASRLCVKTVQEFRSNPCWFWLNTDWIVYHLCIRCQRCWLQLTSQEVLTYLSLICAALQCSIWPWHSLKPIKWQLTFSNLSLGRMNICLYLWGLKIWNSYSPSPSTTQIQQSPPVSWSPFCSVLCLLSAATMCVHKFPLWSSRFLPFSIPSVWLSLRCRLTRLRPSECAVFSHFPSAFLFSCCLLFPASL